MSKNSWGNTCRLCLESKSKFIDTESSEDFALYASTLLLEMYQITLGGSDLPHEVCYECFERASSSWEFRLQVLENQKLLAEQASSAAMVIHVDEAELNGEKMLIGEEIEELKEEESLDIGQESIEYFEESDDIIVEAPWESEDEVQEEIIEEEVTEIPTKKRRKREKNPETEKVILQHFPEFAKIVCPLNNMTWAGRDEMVKQFLNIDCQECLDNRQFPSFEDLQEHYKEQHPDKRCFVTCCKKQFFRRDHLHSHVVIHAYPEAFACFVCKRKMKSKDFLKKHLFTHLPYELRPVKCDLCNKKFLANNQLRVHMMSHEKAQKAPQKRNLTSAWGESVKEEIPEDSEVTDMDWKLKSRDWDRAIYEHFPDIDLMVGSAANLPLDKRDELIRQFVNIQCQECDPQGEQPSFATFEDLQKHYTVQGHIGQPYVRCCRKGYTRKVNLMNHIAIHVNPNAYACPACPHQSKSKDLLKKHLYTHLPKHVRPLECAKCGKRYVAKAQLKFHLATHAKKEDRPFECEDCGKTFAYKYVRDTHRRSHMRVPDYVCEVCAKTFVGKSNYLDHKMRHHEIPDPVLCPICGNKYRNSISLKSHMALHTDRRDHRCEKCQKVFTARSGLLAHIRYVHAEQYLHKCNICKKRLRSKGDYKDHMARHMGETLYNCEFCPKSFSTRSYYFSHRKKAHPVEHAKLPKKQKFFVEN